jgi:vacuolar-type H+-ATPase catalytic subunit A/Vma1
VLLGMMARYTAADVIVVGLIGERGREVKEFIEDILGRKACGAPSSSPRRPTRPPSCGCRAPRTRR